MANEIGILYADVEAACLTVPGVKYVARYNNQFNNEKKNVAFGYPCILIEILPREHRELLMGVQQYDIDVVLHIGFTNLETNNIDVFEFKKNVYLKVNNLQSGFFSMLTRSSEEPDYDHDNVEVFKQTYFATGKDFDSDSRATTSASLTDDLTKSIQKPNTI